MFNLDKIKLVGQGCVWFVLGGMYSLAAYAAGLYAAKLF
jgi:hypothetical protein